MIIRLGPAPLQRPIAWAIAAWRSAKARQAYALIGGKSPLAEFTGAQAAALAQALKPYGDFNVSFGMRYWSPYIGEAVRGMHREGVRKLIALSLYPHYSIATTGSSLHQLNAEASGLGISVGAIEQWCEHPLYIEALTETIKKGIGSFGGGGVFVLFSAHGLPMKIVEGGDPYVGHIRRTIDAVLRRLPVDYALSYQSRTGPVKWLAPYTDEMLRELAGRGVKRVLAVPVSFVSDHIETLYEIDILYKRLAGELGIELRRAPALNCHPMLIEAFKEMVLDKMKELSW